MRLLSLFVDFALNPLEGKQVWDLGALLPAIAALSQDLPARHAVAKNKPHSNSFDILQVMQEDDANKIKVDCMKQDSAFMDSMCLAVATCFTAGWMLSFIHSFFNISLGGVGLMYCLQNAPDST